MTPTEPAAVPPAPAAPAAAPGGRGLTAYFALACGLTWLLALPLALAWSRRVPPPPWVVALAGLSALGPTLAALLVAARRGEVRAVFGRWRTNPVWIVVAPALPAALHLPATALEVALGGHPAQWFYPPVKPEHVAALVMFSFFEEFGWRGFAWPRLVDRHGPLASSAVLGVVWALWHLPMLVSPESGAFAVDRLGVFLVEMPLWCLVIGWVFERGGRSMAVAIAAHAGAHLDNVTRAPDDEVRLRILRVVVLAVAAVLAARALRRRRRDSPPG
jgi:membrane protease YdiL (CAAX protease family)